MKNNSFSFKNSMRPMCLGLAFSVAAAACCVSVYGGAIVVDNDEWTLSSAGFGSEGAANGTAYAQNAAKFLTGGSGSILIYSDNFGLDNSSLESALTTAGYSVTPDPTLSTPFTEASLSAYQAIFLGGNTLPSADSGILKTYVNDGGGVYIAAGTGSISGGAAAEAAQWNSFLNAYGLSLASSFNGIIGTVPVVSTSPVLAGVSQLYYNNGNTVSASGPGKVITYDGLQGLIGTYSSSASVPDETSTGLLTCMSVALLGLGARYFRVNPKALRA
jgi:hypothetical protein